MQDINGLGLSANPLGQNACSEPHGRDVTKAYDDDHSDMRHRSNAFVENLLDQENLTGDVITQHALTRNSDSAQRKSLAVSHISPCKTDEVA